MWLQYSKFICLLGGDNKYWTQVIKEKHWYKYFDL